MIGIRVTVLTSNILVSIMFKADTDSFHTIRLKFNILSIVVL